MTHLRHTLGPLAFLAALALPAAQARAAPDPSWIANSIQTDCSGPSDQATPACESYASDRYEHIDYSFPAPGTADIDTISTGFDADYFYVEWDFRTPWNKNNSTGHVVVVEFDVDGATESNRGDYYVSLAQKEEFDSSSWVDAFLQGGYESYEDANDDVGGANPTASDFGGSPGDGYDTALTQSSDRVWGRIVGGNFQIAVRRSVVGDPSIAALRPWSEDVIAFTK